MLKFERNGSRIYFSTILYVYGTACTTLLINFEESTKKKVLFQQGIALEHKTYK